MIVVSDTSPISNLLLIGRLDLLKSVFDTIVIPPKVHQEVMALKGLGEDVTAYEQSDFVSIQSPSDIKLVERLLNQLDEGESEAIALAVEMNADFLLIDERKGYQISQNLGVNSIGLIGVILKAKSEGIIPKVMPLIDQLRDIAGFWINDSFYDKIKILSGE